MIKHPEPSTFCLRNTLLFQTLKYHTLKYKNINHNRYIKILCKNCVTFCVFNNNWAIVGFRCHQIETESEIKAKVS